MNLKKLTTIPSIFAGCCKKFSKKTALLLQNGNKISYKDLMWDISRTTELLREQGVKKNTKIAFFIDNTPSSVETFFAITRLGAIAVMLQYDFSAKQISEILQAEKPSLAFINKDSLNLIAENEKQTLTIFNMSDNSLLSKSSVVDTSVCNCREAVNAQDIAVIGYELQTTGELLRREISQRLIAESTKTLKKTPVNPTEKQNPFNTLILYCKTLIYPLLRGFAVSCR